MTCRTGPDRARERCSGPWLRVDPTPVVGDLLAGSFLFSERQFGIGDLIRLSPPGQSAGVTGTVEQLTLRVTKLRTVSGEFVDIPVPATEDLDQAMATSLAAADDLAADDARSGLLIGKPVVAGVETIEVGYVRLRLVVRTLPGRQFDVSRELHLRCATALREAGIAVALSVDDPATVAAA